jgi:hypothetical protein
MKYHHEQIRSQSNLSIVAGIMSGMFFLEMSWELFWAGGPGIVIVGATLMRTPLNFI